MGYSKGLARRSSEWSPSLTACIPETHVSPPVSSNVSSHILTPRPDEQNGVLSQSSHLSDQADEARTYLRDLLAGRPRSYEPIEFIIPFLSWCELVNDPEFDLITEQLKIKISYDVLKSVYTIFPMKGKRHARTLGWVGELTFLAKHNFDTSISRKIISTAGEDFNNFKGKWEGSLREPDFAIAWKKDDGGTSIHTIVEVGCSQSGDKLLEVMKIYLKGAPQVSRVILIDITEAPKYVRPRNIDIDELKNIKKEEFRVDSDQGPFWYKGVQWVGYNTISWEVWERDPKSGDPVQIFEATIVPNDSGSQLPFFEIPTRIADGVEAVTVKPADIDHLWHDRLRDAIIDEAALRMAEYVKHRTKKADEAANIARQKKEADKKKQKADEERAARARRWQGD